MSDENAHLNQAAHNTNLLNVLAQASHEAKFADWHTTISFYAALHFLEAIFYKQKVHIICENGMKFEVKHSYEAKEKYNKDISSSIGKMIEEKNPKYLAARNKYISSDHQARHRLILDNRDKLEKLYLPYTNLHETCRKARYHCFSPSKYNHVNAERWLQAIKDETKAILKGIDLEDYPNNNFWDTAPSSAKN